MTAKEKLQELVESIRENNGNLDVNAAMLELLLSIAEAMLPDLPGNDKLRLAAIAVVEARESDQGWNELKNAIADLEAAL